jgi:hypothetical protein
MLSLTVG